MACVLGESVGFRQDRPDGRARAPRAGRLPARGRRAGTGAAPSVPGPRRGSPLQCWAEPPAHTPRGGRLHHVFLDRPRPPRPAPGKGPPRQKASVPPIVLGRGRGPHAAQGPSAPRFFELPGPWVRRACPSAGVCLGRVCGWVWVCVGGSICVYLSVCLSVCLSACLCLGAGGPPACLRRPLPPRCPSRPVSSVCALPCLLRSSGPRERGVGLRSPDSRGLPGDWGALRAVRCSSGQLLCAGCVPALGRVPVWWGGWGPGAEDGAGSRAGPGEREGLPRGPCLRSCRGPAQNALSSEGAAGSVSRRARPAAGGPGARGRGPDPSALCREALLRAPSGPPGVPPPSVHGGCVQGLRCAWPARGSRGTGGLFF